MRVSPSAIPSQAPSRSFGPTQAAAAANLVSRLLLERPECFEGEDLSLAYALESRLREIAASPAGIVPSALTDEETRILNAAELCAGAAAAPGPSGAPPPASAAAAGTTFPVVPVVVGAMAAGLLFAVLAGR